MIRQATKYDKIQLQNMMRMFRDESPVEQYKDIDNPDYFNSIIDSIIAGRGVIFIEDNIGFIMGIISPMVWCNKTFALYFAEKVFKYCVKMIHNIIFIRYRH